ncbi:MAG: phosphatase PAP2 family protein [Xanthobacteraceae bacterium]
MGQDRARMVWWLIAAMAATTVLSLALGGLTVAPFSNPSLLAAVGLAVGISQFYRRIRPDPRIYAITEATTQILLILLFGILLTYAAVTADFPYRDADLYAIDNALGFDRRAYLDFFNHRPWLAQTTSVAYFSMLPQFALVPVLMFVCNRFERLQQMILAIAVALLMTALISVFTPSLTAFVHVDLAKVTHIPAGIYTPEPTMEGLRSGALRVIHLNNLEGLVSFPSFHTAAALIFVWALSAVPYVRWIAVALNLALIAATPIDGAHYAIDVVGGAVVALVAIVVSHWLCRLAADRAAVPRATVQISQPDISGEATAPG